MPIVPCENQARTVGVDLGVKRLATVSDGTFMGGPKPLRSKLRRLARLNRRLHRKVAGSSNRAKAAMGVARGHGRVVSMRGDALHKLTTSLVRACGRIVIEDLNVKGMVRSRRLARAVSDMGLGVFRRQLACKAQPSVSEVVVADRWFPSSKSCRLCGALNDGLKDRTFECNGCGHREGCDRNAARNLERYPGLQGNLDACGHLSAGRSVRLTDEPRVNEAGIPAYLQTLMST